MDFVPTELTPKQKQLQEQAEKYKKMRMSKVHSYVCKYIRSRVRVVGLALGMCFLRVVVQLRCGVPCTP